MTASENLEKTWIRIFGEASTNEGCYQRQLPGSGAWPAHAIVMNPGGNRGLIFEASRRELRKFRFRNDSKGFALEILEDASGRPNRLAIRIRESGDRGAGVFAVFCADIVKHWLDQREISTALAALYRRLALWKTLFERTSGAGLTREEYVGLYGELFFIEAAMDAGLDALRLISAWHGPFQANQDFLFGPQAVEIKVSTGNEGRHVTITNIRQLDPTGLDMLFLAAYSFDFRENSGRTLLSLIQLLRKRLETSSPEAAISFNDRLETAGVTGDLVGQYQEFGFTLRDVASFRVGEGFPAILERDLPPGVFSVSYRLDLSAASAFRISEGDLHNVLLSTHAQ